MSRIVCQRYSTNVTERFRDHVKMDVVWADAQITTGYVRSNVTDPKGAAALEAKKERKQSGPEGPRVTDCEYEEYAPEKGIVNKYCKAVLRWDDGTTTTGYALADSTMSFRYAVEDAIKRKLH